VVVAVTREAVTDLVAVRVEVLVAVLVVRLVVLEQQIKGMQAVGVTLRKMETLEAAVVLVLLDRHRHHQLLLVLAVLVFLRQSTVLQQLVLAVVAAVVQLLVRVAQVAVVLELPALLLTQLMEQQTRVAAVVVTVTRAVAIRVLVEVGLLSLDNSNQKSSQRRSQAAVLHL